MIERRSHRLERRAFRFLIRRDVRIAALFAWLVGCALIAAAAPALAPPLITTSDGLLTGGAILLVLALAAGILKWIAEPAAMRAMVRGIKEHNDDSGAHSKLSVLEEIHRKLDRNAEKTGEVNLSVARLEGELKRGFDRLVNERGESGR